MQIYWNKRKRLHKKRVQLPQDTNMAAVSLFWKTDMAAVTSRENALYALIINFLLPRDHLDQTARGKWTSDVF